MIHTVTDDGVVIRHGVLGEGRAASLQGQQAHHVADFHGFLDEGGHQTRGRHRNIHTPGIVKEPLITRVVHTRHGTRHTKLTANQQGDHQVCLIVTGCGNDHIRLVRVHLAQYGQFAGITNMPAHTGQIGAFLDFGLGVDDGHVVAVHHELFSDGGAHGTGTNNEDLHLLLTFRGVTMAADEFEGVGQLRGSVTEVEFMLDDGAVVVLLLGRFLRNVGVLVVA